MSLKVKLFLFLLSIVLLPLVALSLISYRISLRTVEDHLMLSLQESAENKLAELDLQYRNITDILHQTATAGDMLELFQSQEEGNRRMLSSSLAQVSAKLDYLLYLYGHYLDSAAVVPVDRSHYLLFRRSPSSGNGPIGQYEAHGIVPMTIGRMDTIWSFREEGASTYACASTVIYSGNEEKLLGVLLFNLNMAFLENIVLGEKNAYGALYLLLDESGAPIFSTLPQQWETQAREAGGGGRIARLGGAPYLFLQRESGLSGWKLLQWVPYRAVRENFSAIPMTILVIGVVYFAYCLALAKLFFNMIYKPIERLSRNMTEMNIESILAREEPAARDELFNLESGFNSMKRRISALIQEIQEEQRLQKRMEIQALQSQIMPHFLYNTLNCIQSLVRQGENRRAGEMLTAFIGLLRVSVSNAEEYITFSEEFNYLQCYLLLMNQRYDQKIQIQFELDESLLSCKTLKFILQPIVENSIIHGFDNWERQTPGVIQIRLAREEEGLILEVRDNGRGMKLPEERHGEHFSKIGISNVRERIRMTFGEPYGLSICSEQGAGTTVSIRLPRIE